MKKLTVSKPKTCNEDLSVSKVAQLMAKTEERRIFVLDKSKSLKGIITTTDLAFKVVAKNKLNLKAKDIMSKRIKSIKTDEPLEKALEIMNSLKTYVCPVVDGKKLIGVIHHHDVINFIVSNR